MIDLDFIVCISLCNEIDYIFVKLLQRLLRCQIFWFKLNASEKDNSSPIG